MNGDVIFPRGASDQRKLGHNGYCHLLHFDIDNGCFICIFVTSIIRCSICPRRGYKQDPQHFYRKGHQYKTLPPPERIRSMSEVKKPTVPNIADKPILD